MATSDKAVSTDDFSINLRCSESLGLQTILRALVQQKVEALKGNGDSIKTPSTQSSSSPIIKRLRVLSTSSVSLHDNSNLESRNKGSQKSSGERHAKRTLKNAEDTAEIDCKKHYTVTSPVEDEGTHFLHCNAQFVEKCITPPMYIERCCHEDRNMHICKTHKNEYVSLNIGDEGSREKKRTEEALRRLRRKRKRRKKRMKRLAIATAPVVLEDQIKVIDADELPPRARWTIVATACLLLFMCLLLVGITLRMAPIIDDMVRKENEALINSLNRERQSVTQRDQQNGTTTTF